MYNEAILRKLKKLYPRGYDNQDKLWSVRRCEDRFSARISYGSDTMEYI